MSQLGSVMYSVQIDCLKNTLLSQVYFLENGFYCENSGHTIHSKDRGGIEMPPIARV